MRDCHDVSHYHVIYSDCCSFLVKSAQTNEHDAVTICFHIFFLHRSTERQHDVAKEKDLVFQLDRFQKELKPRLLQRHF